LGSEHPEYDGLQDKVLDWLKRIDRRLHPLRKLVRE
jgi:hypothetical protein